MTTQYILQKTSYGRKTCRIISEGSLCELAEGIEYNCEQFHRDQNDFVLTKMCEEIGIDKDDLSSEEASEMLECDDDYAQYAADFVNTMSKQEIVNTYSDDEKVFGENEFISWDKNDEILEFLDLHKNNPNLEKLFTEKYINTQEVAK